MNVINENRNDNLYFEIADMSSDEKYFRVPVYQSSSYNKMDNEEVVPLTEYYFEAIKLCVINDVNFEKYDLLVENINKLWFASNNNNIRSINEIVKKSTNQIRYLIRTGELHPKGIIVTKSKLEEMKLEGYQNIMSNYDQWAYTKKNKDIIDSYLKGKGSCVAIAMPVCSTLMDKENSYLSLSGTSKDYIGKVAIKKYCVTSEISLMYKAINDFLKYVFGFNFTECHLEENTRRYTYYSKDLSDLNGKVIMRPVSFIKDYKRYHAKKGFARHYSCCEKKIINKMNMVNTDYKILAAGNYVANKLTAYEFRISEEPCKMCRPSIIGCYHIQYRYSKFLHLKGRMPFKHIKISISKRTEPLVLS